MEEIDQDALDALLNALEDKYLAIARKEVVERERAGLAVTPDFLDALERKHLEQARQELVRKGLLQIEE